MALYYYCHTISTVFINKEKNTIDILSITLFKYRKSELLPLPVILKLKTIERKSTLQHQYLCVYTRETETEILAADARQFIQVKDKKKHQ